MHSASALFRVPLALPLVVTLAGSVGMTMQARADLRVCNETGNAVMISLGYRAERGWQSEGWWEAAADGGCTVVYNGDLANRYYYLYAVDDVGGGAWDGEVFMCTRDEAYTITGVGDCLARGYERSGFFEIDVSGRPDWTVNLTDPAVSAGELLGTDDPAFIDEPPPAQATPPIESAPTP